MYNVNTFCYIQNLWNLFTSCFSYSNFTGATKSCFTDNSLYLIRVYEDLHFLKTFLEN